VDYLQRLLWGTSKAVVESLELGQTYKEVVKVISISILYHKLRMDETENTDFIYYGATELIGWHTKKPLVLHGAIAKGEKAPLVTSREVFPEYYMIYVEKFQDMINEDIDEWVYFFKHGKIRDDFKSPGIQLAARKLDCLAMDETARRAYDGYLAYLGQELSIIETAKEEGMEKGLEKGRIEGKIEGKLEIARNMLAVGLAIPLVIKMTGLNETDIARLQSELKESSH
jgi:hypothetical protein